MVRKDFMWLWDKILCYNYNKFLSNKNFIQMKRGYILYEKKDNVAQDHRHAPGICHGVYDGCGSA